MTSTHHSDVNPARRGHHRELPEGLGFEDKDGKTMLVAKTEFNFGALDKGKEKELSAFDEQAEREVFMLFGSLWAEVLEWIYLPKNTRLVGMRLKAVIYCCRPQLMGENTLEKVAKKEGCTKQTFHALTRSFRDHFKIICRSMRTEVSREHMRAAAVRIQSRKKRPTP